jgi:predicted nucleotide-binding protein
MKEMHTLGKSRVFVVHGRNERMRRALFDFLRAIDLRPIEWSEAVALTGKPSPFVGEILDVAMQHAQAIVVLFTGDDQVRLKDEFLWVNDPAYEREATPQSRPNVIFEAGLALGKYPERTILVQVGTLRPFSDIAGRHFIRLRNSSKSRQELAGRLKLAGCEVDLSGTDWHDAGSFPTK